MSGLYSLLNITYIGNLSWLNDVYATLPTILYAILAVVGGAGTVYAIVLGVNLAKSESDEKRKTSSTRLKNTIIGVAVLLVLVLFINIFLPMILKACFYYDPANDTLGGVDPNAPVSTMIGLIKNFL